MERGLQTSSNDGFCACREETETQLERNFYRCLPRNAIPHNVSYAMNSCLLGIINISFSLFNREQMKQMEEHVQKYAEHYPLKHFTKD